MIEEEKKEPEETSVNPFEQVVKADVLDSQDEIPVVDLKKEKLSSR